jgi:hypothetical protein
MLPRLAIGGGARTAGSQFRLYPFGALELAPWQGDEAKTTALIEATFTTAVSRERGAGARFHRLRGRGAVQRPRPVSGDAGRGAAGQ